MSLARREELIRALPYARRYARALTGNQTRGDQLVAQSLIAIRNAPDDDRVPRYALYECVTNAIERDESPNRARGIGLTLKQRELLLLTALEEVSSERAAAIVGLQHQEADQLLAAARERLQAAAATDVLIIEDEPIIAMDIEELVRSCGHRVIGVAASESEAITIAGRKRPGLILADINLGSGGDGTSAVSRILQNNDTPVIFVTAYPERLLTGKAIEPAFVITKPFEPMTLAIATYQAVTGGVHLD